MKQRLATLMPALGAIALIVMAIVAAVISLRAGFQFLPSLNVDRMPLAVAPTMDQDTADPPLSERVVLVITDGLRLDASLELPFLNELRAQGTRGRAVSHTPSISRPNYVSIVTGVPPAHSGVRNNDFDWQVRVDSIMARLQARGRQTAYVSDSSGGFPRLFFDVLEDMDYAPWPGGFGKAAALAIKRAYPLLIMLPGVVDNAGHKHGADSDEYRDAAATLDDDLRAALSGLDLSKSTIVIASDHGHTDGGGHGGHEQEVLDVPIILAGAGVRPGIELDGARLIDVAPTIAALLGVSPPGHGLGRTLTEILTIDEARASRIEAADRARVERNEKIVAKGKSRAKSRVLRSRAKRLAVAIVIGGLGFIMLVFGHRIGALIIDWRAIAFAVPAFPISLYALLEIAGHLSLSSLPDEGSGTRQMLYFGLIATVVHILATNIVLRSRFAVNKRLAAANALTVLGLVVASVPAMLCWAIFGAGPHVLLPSGVMLFVIPALYLAVAAYAAAAAVTLGVELIVFFARVFDPRRPTRRAEKKLARARRLSETIEVCQAAPRDSALACH